MVRLEKDVLMREVVKLERKRKHKIFILSTKVIPHLICFMYIIYTAFGFCGVDLLPISYLFSLSILPWIYIYSASWVFEYCYVHRLPLYYILINEVITTVDYYSTIPINVFLLLEVHAILVGILIFGYTYYYVKYIKTNNTIVT